MRIAKSGLTMMKVGPPLIKLTCRAQGSIIRSSTEKCSFQMAVRSQGTLAHTTPVESSFSAAKPFKSMPAPPEWPLVAHLPLMMKKESHENMHILFEKLREELGDIFRITVPGQGDMVIANNPEDIKTFYSNDGKIPIMPGFDIITYLRVEAMKDRYVSSGLLVNNEDWYEARTKVQQDMMRPKSAFYYIEEIEDIAVELVEKIREERDDDQLFDPYGALQEYALEAVGCVFMGSRLGTLKGGGDGKKLIELNEQALPLMMQLFFLPTWMFPYLPPFKKLVSLMSESFDICKKHIGTAINQVGEEDESLLAKLVKKCGKESGIPLVMGIDALQVGIDTTGSSAIFLLYHLAANPDKQEILYKEICEVIGPNGSISEKALTKMRYMKACQTESQRMLPAIIASTRRTTVDMALGGYHIPVGTTVLRNGYATSNDPRQFPQPEMFMPERWLRNCPQRTSAHPFANIPFGHGARSCIGRRFAQLELYILMVKMVQNFKLEYDGPEVGITNKFIGVPNVKVNISFTERSS